jgi:hypothetical protein
LLSACRIGAAAARRHLHRQRGGIRAAQDAIDVTDRLRKQLWFEATLGKDGAFKTTVMVGNGGSMDVGGVIKDGESAVLLDGYCRFDAKLTRT